MKQDLEATAAVQRALLPARFAASGVAQDSRNRPSIQRSLGGFGSG
jgi:hypothetical protein